MNFKEEYRSTFSQIHASEALQQKIMEATEMENKTMNLTKSKKVIISILAAAALAVGSALAVSAGALNEAVENIRLFINGEEVSASDYLSEDGVKVITEDGGEFIIYNFDLPDGAESAEIEMYLDEVGEDAHSTSVVVRGDVNTDQEETERAAAE